MLTSNALTDVRVLAGIAEELGRPLGFATIAAAHADMVELGPWDALVAGTAPVPATAPRSVGDATAETSGGMTGAASSPEPSSGRALVLSTWRTLIDDSRGVEGDDALKATGRRPVAVALAGHPRGARRHGRDCCYGHHGNGVGHRAGAGRRHRRRRGVAAGQQCRDEPAQRSRRRRRRCGLG